MNTHPHDLMEEARAFAVQHHGTQMYSSEPYSVHLDEVVRVLQEFGVTDSEILQAGYLHDVVEDTPVRVHELILPFGCRVADIVERVTDKPGKSRAERHAATYPAIAMDEDAIQVKLADRIANMRHGTKNDMYRREYPTFQQYLFGRGRAVSIPKMWKELDWLNTLWVVV